MHNNYIESADINHNDQVVLGYHTGTIKLFDLKSNRLIAKTEAHNGQVEDISFSHDGKSIVSAGAGSVRIWNSADLKLKSSSDYPAFHTHFSPQDDQVLISGPELAAIVNAKTAQEEFSFDQGDTAQAIYNNRGDAILIIDFNSGKLKLYDTVSKTLKTTFEAYWPSHAAFSANDKNIVVASGLEIKIFDVEKNTYTYSFAHRKDPFHDYDNWILKTKSLANNTVVSIDNRGCVILFDLNKKAHQEIQTQATLKRTLVNADGKIIVISTKSALQYEPDSLKIISEQKFPR